MFLFILAIPLIVMLFMILFGLPAMMIMESIGNNSSGGILAGLAWIALSILLERHPI